MESDAVENYEGSKHQEKLKKQKKIASGALPFQKVTQKG
jgi:hypothetical protein